MCTKMYTETQRFGLKDWFLQREIKRCKYITCPGLAQLVISICNKINPTIHLHGEHNHIYIISVLICMALIMVMWLYICVDKRSHSDNAWCLYNLCQ